jgi:uncharacterized protein YegL
MSIVRLLRRLRGQRGQVLVMFVGIFSLITLMGAITIDFGLWLSERRGVQRAADFAALAGSQDLLQGRPTPGADESAAIQSALDWAERNGYEDGVDGVTVTPKLLCRNTLANPPADICRNSHPSSPQPDSCSVGGHCDAIRVTISKPGTHLFSKMFNIGDVQVGFASAAGVSLDVTPLDVVLFIDTSGSMGPDSGCTGTPCRTRIEWAKQAALTFVNEIAGGSGSSTLGNNHVEVIAFDGNGAAYLVGPALGNSNANAVRTAIAGVTNPSGDTYIAKGIQKATTDLNAHTHSGSYKVVVLLSDGRNYANNDPMSGTTCNNTHDRRTKTVTAIGPLHDAADTVFTVGIGDQTGGANNCNPYELDTALLGDIAEGPPGYYKQVIDASTLPTVFQAIAWKIAGRALTE